MHVNIHKQKYVDLKCRNSSLAIDFNLTTKVFLICSKVFKTLKKLAAVPHETKPGQEQNRYHRDAALQSQFCQYGYLQDL